MTHDPNHPSPFKSRMLPPCRVAVNKKRKIYQKTLLEYKPYLDALCLLQFSLLLLPEADNANLRTDIVGFGLSKNTNNQSYPIYHQSVEMKLANEIKLQLGSGSLKKIPFKNWERPVYIASNAPEDNTKSRVWTVQFVTVLQMTDTTHAKESRGNFPLIQIS